MSLERQRVDIQTDFSTRFAVLEPDVNITFENVEYIPPTNESWVRLSFNIIEQFKPCISTGRLQTDAIFTVQIFVPTAQGANDASRISDSVVEFCETATLSGIEFLTYEIDNTGVEDGWYTLLLRATYRGFDAGY